MCLHIDKILVFLVYSASQQNKGGSQQVYLV